MTSDLLVRLANPDDARAIAQLLRGVFAETYGHAISHDALQRYLDTAFSEEAIAHSGTAHLLAFCNDDLAGVSELTLSQPPTCVPTARCAAGSCRCVCSRSGSRGQRRRDAI